MRRLESLGARNLGSSSRSRAVRMQIRRRAPIVALVPPALLAVVAAVFLNWGGSTARGYLGTTSVLAAAPTAIIAGVPVKGGGARYLVVALTSAVLWMVIGVWAAARATRTSDTTWRDFWRTYLSMAVPLAVGVLCAYAVVQKLVK